jgi:uncharacterized membrane protein YfcA
VDATPLRDALTVAAGIGTGGLSAAFGVGGAIVSTPAIRALGASATVAIGTTLPAILPGALAGTVRYLREHLILWPVVAWTTAFGVVASVGGSLLSRAVPGHGHWLQVLTAALLAMTAWRMALGARRGQGLVTAPPSPEADGPLPDETKTTPAEDQTRLPVSPWLLGGIGLAAGGLSGLLGVGGGIVLVPAFVELADIPLRAAIATSLVCVGLFAIPGTVTHAFLGDVDWRFALGLAAGVVPGARLGAVIALRSSDRRLRLAVSGFLGVAAVIYATGELIALR